MANDKTETNAMNQVVNISDKKDKTYRKKKRMYLAHYLRVLAAYIENEKTSVDPQHITVVLTDLKYTGRLLDVRDKQRHQVFKTFKTNSLQSRKLLLDVSQAVQDSKND